MVFYLFFFHLFVIVVVVIIIIIIITINAYILQTVIDKGQQLLKTSRVYQLPSAYHKMSKIIAESVTNFTPYYLNLTKIS